MRVYVRGGPGGQGMPKFGGKGGRGGHVYAVAQPDATLKQMYKLNPSKRFTAAAGENSRVRSLLGAPGKDIELAVPPGVIVRNDEGLTLGELNEANERVLLARGGEGGGPKNSFKGQKGVGHSVTLDLKLIADIGLVGFPNAGKSTLLGAVSRAAPKIAAYPFTTIQPQLGTMVYQDHRRISVADLPGLIEGAHVNVGMGHSFLKHVERTSLLLFLVDIHGFRLRAQHQLRTGFETVLLLMKELELYKEELVSKPAVLALNKVDMEGSDVVLEQLMDQLADIKGAASDMDPIFQPDHIIQFDDIIPISARAKTSTYELKNRLRELLDLYADIEYEKEKGTDMVLKADKVQAELHEHMKGRPML